MRKSWVVYLAVIIHLAWGISLLIDPAPRMVTSIAFTSDFFSNRIIEGLVFIVVSLMAGADIIFSVKKSILGILMLIPQQIILILSATGAVTAMIFHQFPDGIERPFLFIFSDQLPAVLLAVFHTCAIWQHYGSSLWAER